MEELHHENVGSRNERTKFRRAETLPVRFAASDSTGRRLETKSSTFSSNTPFSSQRNPQYSSRKGFRPREEPHQSTTFLKRRPHKRSTFLNDVVFGSGAQRVSRETASEGFDLTNSSPQFRLSRWKTFTTILDKSAIADSEAFRIPNSSEPPGQRHEAPPLGILQNVFDSKYTGDGTFGGLHTAKFIMRPNVPHAAEAGPSPMFRWIHFEDATMDLYSFQEGIMKRPELSEVEKKSVLSILERARRRYDKPFQTSATSNTRYMNPSIIRDRVPIEAHSRKAGPRFITWLCLPYFRLATYSNDSSLTSSSSHPQKTLMQVRFSLTRKQRDMEQAVCCIAGSPKGHCFHISQLWALVLDDSFLLTCANTSLAELQKNTISSVPTSTLPLNDLADPSLLVAGWRTWTWSIPLSECSSWFGFLSKFAEYWPKWPQQAQFYYDGKSVKPEDWPKIVNAAQTGTAWIQFRINPEQKLSTSDPFPANHMLLSSKVEDSNTDESSVSERRTVDVPETPSRSESHTPKTSSKKVVPVITDNGVTNPEETKNQSSGSQLHSSHLTNAANVHSLTLAHQVLDSQHVKGTVNARSSQNLQKRTSKVQLNHTHSEQNLIQDLIEIDEYVRNKIPRIERLAYECCPEKSRDEVHQVLEQSMGQKSFSRDGQAFEQLPSGDKIAVVTVAEKLFRFFLPLDFQGPTVLKFWGALLRFLLTQTIHLREAIQYPDVRDFLSMFRSISEKLQSVQDLLWTITLNEKSTIDPPRELTLAWIHLLICLTSSLDEESFYNNGMKFLRLAETSIESLIRRLRSKSLVKYTVLMPFEIFSLVSLRLLHDVTGPHLDITETYREYIRTLEVDIEANPLDRRHQDTITRLKQELAAVGKIVGQQRRMIDFLSNVGPSELSHLVEANFEKDLQSNDTIDEDGNYYRNGMQDSLVAYSTENNQKEDEWNPSESTMASGPYLSPTDPDGYRGLFISECQTLIKKRLQDFDELDHYSSGLEVWNVRRIDEHRDSRETALFAFAGVTVVFLPLSTVASIFGMNTSDIRDMEDRQWLFWAIALPLTIAILLLVYFWDRIRRILNETAIRLRQVNWLRKLPKELRMKTDSQNRGFRSWITRQSTDVEDDEERVEL